MSPDFDAIAVGGGLAGGAFALALARQGLKVAVVERSPGPRLKVCGDFLSREAQRLLVDLEIDVWAEGAEPIGDFRLATGRKSATAPLPFRAAGLSRLRLDELLLTKAERAGAHIVRGEPASALERADHHIAVRIGPRRLTAGRVALATGKHNLRGFKRSAHGPSAFKMSFELTPGARHTLAGVVQLVGYRGGYIGACNIEGGAATLCWLADKSLMQRSGGRWWTQVDDLARRSPYIGDILIGARAMSEKPAAVAAVPFGYIRRDAISPRVYPIGDQLAVIPSCTGDGTSIALTSGLAAARAVLRNVDSADYQRVFTRNIGSQFRWAGAVNQLFKTRATRSISVAAMALFPGLATGLTRMTRLRDNALADALEGDGALTS